MKKDLAIFLKKEPYTQENFQFLEEVNEKYPYFHRAKISYLKALKEKNSPNYNDFLKNVAAATQQRSLLFEYITNFKTHSQPKNQIHNKTPLEFSKKDEYSFSQWMALTEYMPVNVKNISEPSLKKYNRQNDLIDKFIAENPRIPKIETAPAQEQQKKEVQNHFDPSALMTETLARVYVAQKKYEKALEAYKILSLKYPEKKTIFAKNMNEIKNEIKNSK